MRFHQPPFEAKEQYIAVHALLLNGRLIKAGEPLPSDIPIRRLRQLYEKRDIRVSPAPSAQPKSRMGEKGKKHG